MLKQLEKLNDRINDLTTEVDSYHIDADDLESIEDYGKALDHLNDSFSELLEAGDRLIERLEDLQEQIENIDQEDYEDEDYEDD
jgi:hypothetical protein